MLTLGPLAFAAPLALAGLILLPAIWWLLRATPPPPNRTVFPPLRLLLNLRKDEETPDRTPLWLVAFRILAAALIILGLSRPILFPREAAPDAPLLLAVDDGWAAAQDWERLVGEARARIGQAARAGQDVTLVITAPGAGEATLTPVSPREAQSRIEGHRPAPWPVDRAAAAARIASLPDAPAYDAVYLSSGFNDDAAPLLAALQGKGRLSQARVLVPPGERAPLWLGPPETGPAGLRLEVRRAEPSGARNGDVVALSADGRLIARAGFSFSEDAVSAEARFDMPPELRRRIALFRIPGAPSAGTAQIIDDRWTRPAAGLASVSAQEDDQPLLSDLFYLERALEGRAEARRGRLSALIADRPGLILLPDGARIDDAQALMTYAEDGGVVVRFAGPRMAANADAPLPVRLRQGGRALGGALAWDAPQALAPFAETSPFAGLALDPEVSVSRQVLAEPEPDLDAKTWARLQDGTPLVTAERAGRGWIVLFHVSANPQWSNLPISGLFPRMLSRIAALARAGGAGEAAGGGPFQLERAVSHDGRIAAPEAAVSLAAESFPPAPGADAPPGLYRRGAEAAALNLIGEESRFAPLEGRAGVRIETYGDRPPNALGGALLAAALTLLALDALIALALSGRLRGLTRRLAPGGAAALAAMTALLAPDGAAAQDEAKARAGALEMRFAYVRVGDPEIDALSAAGLTGLTRALTARTAVEPADPVPVDPETDALTVYPLIYWPVREQETALSETAAARVDAYLKSGGTILFDTRDGGTPRPGGAHPGLVTLLQRLDVPALSPAPQDHVLTRSFYLLDRFPGRWSEGALYVEAQESAERDGVSAVIVGANDYAAAWAVDEAGRPLAAVSGDARQRELAYRFGVNLAMYVLTGNYKADQVHVPALLERLGQ